MIQIFFSRRMKNMLIKEKKAFQYVHPVFEVSGWPFKESG
jgi:hypothetical protein